MMRLWTLALVSAIAFVGRPSAIKTDKIMELRTKMMASMLEAKVEAQDPISQHISQQAQAAAPFHLSRVSIALLIMSSVWIAFGSLERRPWWWSVLFDIQVVFFCETPLKGFKSLLR